VERDTPTIPMLTYIMRQKCVNGAGNINALFFFRLGRYSQARRKFNLSKSGDKRQTKNRLEAAA